MYISHRWLYIRLPFSPACVRKGVKLRSRVGESGVRIFPHLLHGLKLGIPQEKNGKGSISKAGKKHGFQQLPLVDPRETVLVPACFGR